MTVFCLSYNHQNVPIDVRERFAWDAGRRRDFLRQLLDKTDARGAMLLSTCNRLEFYSSGEGEAWQPMREYISAQLERVFQRISGMGRDFREQECARHLIKVACGLDSQSVGETQILGQIKTAYQLAAKAEALDSELHHLCQHVFYSAKRIRHNLELNRYPVSIAGTAVRLMRQLFPEIHDKNILIIGAGSTGRIVAENLHKLNFSQLCILNRTASVAAGLAGAFGAEHGGLEKIAERIPWADIIFCCIDNRPSLVGKGMVESGLRKRRHTPQIMLDLGVPRNIEPEVGELSDVYLYDLDQIHQISQGHLGLRREKAGEAQRLIDAHVEEYQRRARLNSAGALIGQYRQTMLAGNERLIERALRRADKSGAAEAMRWLLRQSQGQSLHQPTVLLRKLAEHSPELARELTESPLLAPERDGAEE